MRTMLLTATLAALAGGHGCRQYLRNEPVAERTARLSPKATPRLPAGVARGEALAIDYPGDALVDLAVEHYLEVAVARGAFYVSSLALVFDEGATCAQTLMPESLTREQGVAYVTKKEYRDGATADSVHLRQEAVAVPYVRAIDDLPSMLHEMKIWSTKYPARCRPEAPAKLRVFAQIHGREAIGLLPGQEIVDLRACAVAGGGVAPGSTAPTPAPAAPSTLPLGSLDDIATIERTLGRWMGARVRVAHGDVATEGRLVRYLRQVMSVEQDDGRRAEIHVLDALAIERLDGGGDVAAPMAPAARPEADRARTVEPTPVTCPRWLVPGEEAF